MSDGSNTVGAVVHNTHSRLLDQIIGVMLYIYSRSRQMQSLMSRVVSGVWTGGKWEILIYILWAITKHASIINSIYWIL